MSEKKERKGRRAYLNDFRQDIDGKYIYDGDRYVLSADGPDYKQVRKTVLPLTAVIAVLTLAGGFLPAKNMLDCFYCIIPYCAELIAVLTVIWAAVKLYKEGEEIRGYVYEKSVSALPQRAFLAALFAAAGAVGTAIYVMLNGFSGTAAYTSAYFVLKLLTAAASWKLHKTVLSLKWDVKKPNSPQA